MPYLEAENIFAKNLAFLAHADAAGVVLGARADRADLAGGSVHGRLASCAVVDVLSGRRARCKATGDPNMDAILVINAGSSSLKFHIFEMTAGGLERRVRGQMDGIGTRPRLAASGEDATVLVDRQYTPDVLDHLPAAIAETRAWLQSLEGFKLRAIGHRIVHGGPNYVRGVQGVVEHFPEDCP